MFVVRKRQHSISKQNKGLFSTYVTMVLILTANSINSLSFDQKDLRFQSQKLLHYITKYINHSLYTPFGFLHFIAGVKPLKRGTHRKSTVKAPLMY